jgi:hypothetical protein
VEHDDLGRGIERLAEGILAEALAVVARVDAEADALITETFRQGKQATA